MRWQRAHVDNRGLKRFFERMAKEEPNLHFLSDHPASRARAELADQVPNTQVLPIMSSAEWAVLKDCAKAE